MKISGHKKRALRAQIIQMRPEGFEPPTLGSEDLSCNISSFYPCKGFPPSHYDPLSIPRFFSTFKVLRHFYAFPLCLKFLSSEDLYIKRSGKPLHTLSVCLKYCLKASYVFYVRKQQCVEE